MQLEKLAAVLRPREGSESAELGLQMLGRWRGQIYRAWFLVALPVWLVCTAIALITPVAGLLAFWWLKPLMERGPLYVVSDRLFGGEAKLGGLVRGHARLWKDFFVNHSIRRFSLNRGVLAPVSMLEGLSGGGYSKRARVIASNTGSLLGLTIACFLVALHVVLAVYLILLLFTPEPYHWIYFWRWDATGSLLQDVTQFIFQPKPVWEQLLHCVVMLAMVSVTSPIYAVCGFAVYINRRTEIECWDIELQFRKIAKRIANVSLVFLAVLVLLPEQAQAQIDCDKVQGKVTELRADDSVAKQELAEVLTRPEFSLCQTKVVYYEQETDARGEDKRSDNNDSSPFGSPSRRSGGASVGDILLVVAAIMVGFMLFVILQKLGWMASKPVQRKIEKEAAITFDEVAVELQADGDLDAARAMWEQGDHRGALALLYRTAVLRLHHHYRAPIGKGATEGDCLRWAKRNLREQQPLIRCLTILTRHWQWIAYGHRMPELNFDELVDLWKVTFARLAE